MSGGLPDYGTFYPILAALVHRTTGPVLELGAGACSTPMLHFMCSDPPRLLVTAENDKEWYEKFKKYQNAKHSIYFVDDWTAWAIIESFNWDVALVDHAPGERRVEEVKRLKDRCRFIVCHDTEEVLDRRGSGGNYGWADVYPLFKYVWTWTEYRPHTTVVSNFEEFKP